MNKSFEDQWKDALGDASQTPPPDIWNRIEAELDSKRRGFILWRNPRLLSGAAAAILIVLSTLYFTQQSPEIAQVPKDVQRIVEEKYASENLSENEAGSISLALQSAPLQRTLAQNYNSSNVIAEDDVYTVERAVNTSAPVEYSSIPAEKLSSKGVNISSRDYYLPNVHVDRDLKEQKRNRKGGWFNLSAQNAPFQPNFNAPGLQQAALSAAMNSNPLVIYDKTSLVPGENAAMTSNRNDIQDEFDPGKSFTVGVGVGKKLGKKWGIESGLRYTHATAINKSNVYAFDKNTGKSDSFSFNNYVTDKPTDSEILISVDSKSRHSYHFLAVPVLMSYDVVQLGNFRMQAVAGVSTEFFLKGSVKNANSEKDFDSSNSKFKPVNFAGVAGLRLSYPVTTNLDLQLGGQYQHYLTSGLENSGGATFRPSMLGIQLGLQVRR